GAAKNDVSRGKYVGTLNYTYANGILDIRYAMFSGFSLQETHVYAGNSYVTTGAPGQFGNTHGGLVYGTATDSFRILIADPENDGIFVVAHASVCIQ
ncbi:MAG: hypothetical protein OEW08_14635, partial [Gammaproteobacteria bacterium]|nr:hypothetical protein [Gammaproteobacteria bacterium]